MPRLGRFIAVVQVEEGGPVTFERTTRTPGHFTLWGDPATLLARVRAVVPV
jgi:hypothetical protein